MCACAGGEGRSRGCLYLFSDIFFLPFSPDLFANVFLPIGLISQNLSLSAALLSVRICVCERRWYTRVHVHTLARREGRGGHGPGGGEGPSCWCLCIGASQSIGAVPSEPVGAPYAPGDRGAADGHVGAPGEGLHILSSLRPHLFLERRDPEMCV